MMESTVYISEASRLYVLIALLLAAWGKTIGFGKFRKELIDSFPSLSNVSALVALLIVAAEWLIAALLLSGGAASRAGLAAALALFSVFTAVISVSLVQERAMVCSCFGSSSHRISAHDLVRNVLFMGAAGFSLMHPPIDGSIDGISRTSLAGVALIIFLLSTSMQDVALLLRARVEE